MTTDPTPTESLVGFDANGLPERHSSPASRQHTDQHEDTTRIQSVSQAEILRASGYESPDVRPVVSLPHREDLAYMAPELVAQMLARCNHVCRTHGCGTVVSLCGSFCEDCQTEIDAHRQSWQTPRPAWWRRLWNWITTHGKANK